MKKATEPKPESPATPKPERKPRKRRTPEEVQNDALAEIKKQRKALDDIVKIAADGVRSAEDELKRWEARREQFESALRGL